MFRVTRYLIISKTESGRVGYRKKYRVAGRVWVPAGHCKWAGKANILHYMAKNDILGLNLADLGQEFCLLGGGKTFGTFISRTNETHRDNNFPTEPRGERE